MNRLIILAMVLPFISGCQSPFSSDEDIAKSELLLLAPKGSDAKKAKQKLEEKGFRCYWVENGTFAGLDEGKHSYLYCNQEVAIVWPLLSRRWQLALIHEKYIVKNAIFGISATGL